MKRTTLVNIALAKHINNPGIIPCDELVAMLKGMGTKVGTIDYCPEHKAFGGVCKLMLEAQHKTKGGKTMPTRTKEEAERLLREIQDANAMTGDYSIVAGTLIKENLKEAGATSVEELEMMIHQANAESDVEVYHLPDHDERQEQIDEIMGRPFTEEDLFESEQVSSTTKGTVPANKPSGGSTMAKSANKKYMNKDAFRPTLGGVQLQPNTEKVMGVHIVPFFDKEGAVEKIVPNHDFIEIAEASAFRAIPGIQYVTIDSEDAGVKAQCLYRYLRAINHKDVADGIAESEWRIACGNIKKSDCVMGVAPKKLWDEFFGCDIRMLNLWKVILPIMTPTGVEIRPEYSNIQSVRLRVLDSMVTSNGYPEHDGDIVWKVWAEFYRHSDLDKDGMPKPGAKVKKINRNWQLRASGILMDGRVMPAIKAKPYADDDMYLRMCERFGVGPDEQDGFITKDNLKTLKWEWNHMDVMDIPITNIRNVKTKMKDWSSSMGAQSLANSDHLRTREVFNGHGILHRADIIKGAAELKLADIVSVMESDKEASWDDALSMPIKCMFARYTNGSWFVPRMNRDTFYTRLESFWKDYGIKLQIAKDGYYIQGDDRLDEMEDAYEMQAPDGKLQYFVLLPKTAKFINKISVGDKIDIGRDPNVGPSNLMTFVVAGYNDSHDSLVMSWQSIYAMYGDVDGDTAKYETLIANMSERVFPCIKRPAPGLGKDKPKMTELPPLRSWLVEHETIGMSVLKSAKDTGSLDLTTRQIIEERMYANNPINIPDLMELSQLRQDAIDGLKHTDAGVALDAREQIIMKYGVAGCMNVLKNSPITYRLLRKDAGQPRKGDVMRFIERIKLINEAQPHAMHPYKDFFDALKGIKGIEPGSELKDSEWLFNALNNLQIEMQNKHKAGGYVFPISYVFEMAKWMTKDHKNKSLEYLKLPEDMRKVKFTELREFHRSIVKQKCTEMFGNDTCLNAVIYQRQLTIALGVKGFGRGHKPVNDGSDNEIMVPYGKGGGAMWSMLEEHTIFVAETLNLRAVARGEFPCMNPFMDKIKDALRSNREKAAEKVLRKAAEKLEEMD